MAYDSGRKRRSGKKGRARHQRGEMGTVQVLRPYTKQNRPRLGISPCRKKTAGHRRGKSGQSRTSRTEKQRRQPDLRGGAWGVETVICRTGQGNINKEAWVSQQEAGICGQQSSTCWSDFLITDQTIAERWRKSRGDIPLRSKKCLGGIVRGWTKRQRIQGVGASPNPAWKARSLI